MATTGSSGLNNALNSTAVTQTTLPSWYDTAQQNVINQAGTAAGQAPQFQNTAAQGAVNTLQGQNNPFTQAQGTLNTIAQGAANPWIVNPQTGATTPNTNTAMGGLFSAQQNQLNQLLPSQIAGTEAGAIGSGNFGSLRGQTAVDTAKAQALSTLQAQQMQSALQNQQTGASAANSLGNVGAEGITSGLTTGAAQMNAPFQNPTNYANLVNSVNAPTTASEQTQGSLLSQVGALGSILNPNGTAGGLSALLFGTPATKTAAAIPGMFASAGLGGALNNLWNGTGSSSTDPTAAAQQDALNKVANTPDITNNQSDPNSPDFIGP
jgi:hypothetical protein